MKKTVFKIFSLVLAVVIFSTSTIYVSAESMQQTSQTESISLTEYDPATGKETVKTYEVNSSIIEALKAMDHNSEYEASYSSPSLLQSKAPANLLSSLDDEFAQVGLTKVQNTLQMPYSPIGFLNIDSGLIGPGPLYGTGFMISDNVVLTAAHNLYNLKKGKWYHGGNFYPARYGLTPSKVPFGAPYIVRQAVCTKYIESTNTEESIKHDWGAIVLSDNVGKKCGKLKIAALSTTDILNGYKLKTVGYPQSKSTISMNYCQYQQISNIASVHPEVIQTFAGCFSGQSGSPVFASNNTVCAILTHGTEDPKQPGAYSGYTRITDEVYAYLMQYVAENA